MDNPRPQGRVVCVTFEGVLNDAGEWRGEEDLGEPRVGARAFVERLREHGWEVVILTALDPARVRAWLERHTFAERHDQRERPPARAYLDPRALRFDGNFEGLEARLDAFHPYWEPQ